LGNVIGEKSASVWTALERGMRGYDGLLEERAKLINETTELARQNEELKVLLQEYLSSKINTDLEVPPTRLKRTEKPAAALVRVGAGAGALAVAGAKAL